MYICDCKLILIAMKKFLLLFIMFISLATTVMSASDKASGQLVVPGKTWWYTQDYSPVYTDEYGLKIGDACDIDGAEWYPVTVSHYGIYFRQDYGVNVAGDKEFGVSNEFVCWVREDGGKLYTRLQPYQECPSFLRYFRFGPFWDHFYNFGIEEPKDVVVIENTIRPTVGEALSYSCSDCHTNWECTGMAEETNSGISYQKYSISSTDVIDENEFDYIFSRKYSVIPQIGWVEPEETYVSTLFFAPGGVSLVPSLPYHESPVLRYVNDSEGNVIYEALGGLKLWQEPMSVSDITAPDVAAAEEWYTLDGRRIENPAGGIYIRRCGTTVTKVALP